MGGLGTITLENSTLFLGGPGGIQPTLDWLFVLPPGSEGERPRVGSPCSNRPRWILTGSSSCYLAGLGARFRQSEREGTFSIQISYHACVLTVSGLFR